MSASVEKSLKNLRARMKKHREKVRAKLKSSKKFDTERTKTVPTDTKEESNEVAPVINLLDQDQHLIDNRLRAGDEHSSYSNSDSDLSNYDDGDDDTGITHNEAFKCIVNHGAYYACERCLCSGYDYMKRIVYPFMYDQERTGESFKNRENPLHHSGDSPLEKLKKPHNLVLLFILDIMHLNYQGNMKKLLKSWFSSESKITQEKLYRVSLRLVNLKRQIPVGFQRSTRSAEDVSKYTANEFREILVYTGPFVLKDILDDEEYKHYLLFHTGSRILCSSELYKKYTTCAKEYLQRFTMLTEELYGLEFASLNNHSLAHIADDVENMDCPASFLTAFPFENDLGELKRFIRSGNKPLAQICTKIERFGIQFEESCYTC
ncbi:hypothetical protein QAD02_009253 [Eretmocerus hayati]|uniref:Uncharacterized protein n=1 Tax=Eretmocerus hayati TaxID=131215 RepID=A0ACC2ND81_9HYME|nr:hypothetical protein QAD02_009253 [Eretmocerus hayati]